MGLGMWPESISTLLAASERGGGLCLGGRWPPPPEGGLCWSAEEAGGLPPRGGNSWLGGFGIGIGGFFFGGS